MLYHSRMVIPKLTFNQSGKIIYDFGLFFSLEWAVTQSLTDLGYETKKKRITKFINFVADPVRIVGCCEYNVSISFSESVEWKSH